MLPRKWMNFNRFFMERIFIDIQNHEDNFKFSIINCKNTINKELLSNIINRMIDFKNEVDKHELQKINLRKSREETKIDEESKLNEKIENLIGTLTDYFELLLDYIFFEDNFMYNREINYRLLYEKFISYYGGLSALNKNNYSYIYEYDYNKIPNESIEWTEYIKKEYKSNRLKLLHKAINSLDKFFVDKTSNKNIKEENERTTIKFGENQYKKSFFDIIFMILESIIVPYQDIKKKETNPEEVKNIISIINAIIKIILSEGDKDFIFNIYENAYKEGDYYDLKRKNMLRNIRDKIINDINKKDACVFVEQDPQSMV